MKRAVREDLAQRKARANERPLCAFKAMLARSPNRRSNFRAVDTANRFEAADVALGLGLARAKDHPLVRIVGLASEIGSWKSLLSLSAGTLVLGLMVRDRRMAEAGRHMLQAGVLAGVVKTSLKRTVHRTRPNVLMEEGFYVRGWPGTGVGPWQSFPSGHSALSTAVACAAARAYPEIKGPAYAAAAGVVAAQVLRGAHFPADVLTGAVIGIAAEFTVDRLTRDRRRSPRWHR